MRKCLAKCRNRSRRKGLSVPAGPPVQMRPPQRNPLLPRTRPPASRPGCLSATSVASSLFTSFSTRIYWSRRQTLRHLIYAYHYLLPSLLAIRCQRLQLLQRTSEARVSNPPFPVYHMVFRLDEHCFYQDAPCLPDIRLTSPMTAKKAPE